MTEEMGPVRQAIEGLPEPEETNASFGYGDYLYAAVAILADGIDEVMREVKATNEHVGRANAAHIRDLLSLRGEMIDVKAHFGIGTGPEKR